MNEIAPQRAENDLDWRSISEFSTRHGVTLRTIRFYESFGLLHPRRVGNQRYFSSKDSVRMDLTLTAKRLGFSLREIRELIDAHVSNNNQQPQAISALIDKEKMRKKS